MSRKSQGSAGSFVVALGLCIFLYVHLGHHTAPPAAVTAVSGGGSVPDGLSYYTASQLAGLWQQAGGAAWATNDAVCIAEHESTGNTYATDYDSNGTVDRGLWQINSIHGSQSTFDAYANAAAAVQLSGDGSSWHLWTTHADCGL